MKTIEKLLQSNLYTENSLNELIDRIKKLPHYGDSTFIMHFTIPNDDGTTCKLNFYTKAYDDHLHVSLEEDFNDIEKRFVCFMPEFWRNQYSLKVSSLMEATKDVLKELEYRKSLEEVLKSNNLDPKGISKSIGFHFGDETCLRFVNVKLMDLRSCKTVLNFRNEGHTNHFTFHGIPFYDGVLRGLKFFFENKIEGFPFNVECISMFPSQIRDEIIKGVQP